MEKFQIEKLSLGIILHVCFRSKSDIRKISTGGGGVFLNNIFLCSVKIELFSKICIIVSDVT